MHFRKKMVLLTSDSRYAMIIIFWTTIYTIKGGCLVVATELLSILFISGNCWNLVARLCFLLLRCRDQFRDKARSGKMYFLVGELGTLGIGILMH